MPIPLDVVKLRQRIVKLRPVLRPRAARAK
jgi:hypothetical protein